MITKQYCAIRYEEMLSTPSREIATTATIYIPPGPRLGDVVIEAKNVNKAYGEKQLMKDLSFSIPQGAIVGVIGTRVLLLFLTY